MPPLKDLTGRKFGHLTVIKRAPNKGSHVAWECLCDCGNTTIVRGNNLTRENYKTTTCGCRIGKSIIGEQYGTLTIIEDLGNNNSRRECRCKCSCGKIITVRYSNLKSGSTSSCGDRQAHNIRGNWNDLTGQKFGKLTVIQETDKRIDNKIVWRCQCECGNTVDVISTNLLKGNTLSCGCLKSKGEKIIGLLFSQNNIQFEKDKTFPTLRGEKNSYLRCDFFVQNTYIVEFDGLQHFTGWGQDKDNLLIQQRRDQTKNKWCKENNIPLIRIPYTKLDTLCLEDLILETTQFRVV